jgi:uncharacterized protein (DUF1778 family)
MPRSAPKAAKENRLSIRANAAQKSALARAAKARHMNVSQFVLQASLRAAEEVIETESRLAVPPEEYQWLCQMMDEPAQPTPRLREALARKQVWDG